MKLTTRMHLCNFQFEEVADKDDLMGVEDTAKKSILSVIYLLHGSLINLSATFLSKMHTLRFHMYVKLTYIF